MRAILISDNPVLMDGIEAMLARRLPALQVIGKCFALDECLKAAKLLLPDIAVIDGAIKGLNQKTVEQFAAGCRHIAIVISNEPRQNEKEEGCFKGGLDEMATFLEGLLNEGKT